MARRCLLWPELASEATRTTSQPLAGTTFSKSTHFPSYIGQERHSSRAVSTVQAKSYRLRSGRPDDSRCLWYDDYHVDSHLAHRRIQVRYQSQAGRCKLPEGRRGDLSSWSIAAPRSATFATNTKSVLTVVSRS